MFDVLPEFPLVPRLPHLRRDHVEAALEGVRGHEDGEDEGRGALGHAVIERGRETHLDGAENSL